MGLSKRFGPFILERMIGRGGMGAVYRAHREDTGQVVAVKALILPLEQERERFTAEIETMKLLRHDNIVRLYGFGQEDGVLYYAMEYVDGPSLSTLLKRGRRFTWEEVVYIGASVCRALKHAHDRGIVHRDIKPANILLVDSGVVKVSDYGIAQYFGNSRLTSANQVVGTIEFMSPEQARAGALTPHTDMYALGALMYALLTGKPPYVARDLTQLLQQFRQGPPESTRSFRPEIPQVVDDVIFDLLEIQVDKRPGDARIIGRRLEALLKTSPNCPDGNPFSAKRFSLERLEESVDSASRVDLENPSSTEERAAEERREAIDVAPDIPYSAVDDPEPVATSPYDQTTERAQPSDYPDTFRHAEQDKLNDSAFVLGDETYDNSKASDLRTSTFVPDASERSETSTKEATVSCAAANAASQDANQTEFELDSASDGDFVLKEGANSNSVDAATVAAPAAAFDPASAATISAEKAFDGSNVEVEYRAPVENSPMAKYEAPTVEASGKSSVPKPERETPPELNVPKPAIAEVKAVPTPEKKGKTDPWAVDSDDDIPATPLSKFKRSQFVDVHDSELGDLPKAPEEARPWFYWLRFPLMLFVFGGLVLLVANLFKAPSADALYERLDKKFSDAAPDEFLNELKRSEDDMRKFVDMYPNDPRGVRVQYFLCESELNALERNMQNEIEKPGRASLALPIERAYIEASRAAIDDWDEGSKRLCAFVALFGSENCDPASMDQALDEWAKSDLYVSEYQLRQKEHEDAVPANPNVKPTLRERLQAKKDEARDVKGNLWRLWRGQRRTVLTKQEQLVVLAKRQLVSRRRQEKKTDLSDLALLNSRLETIQEIGTRDVERANNMTRAVKVLYADKDWAQSVLQSLHDIEPNETPKQEQDSDSEDEETPLQEPNAAPQVEEPQAEASAPQAEASAPQESSSEPQAEEPQAEASAPQESNAEPEENESPDAE